MDLEKKLKSYKNIIKTLIGIITLLIGGLFYCVAWIKGMELTITDVVRRLDSLNASERLNNLESYKQMVSQILEMLQ